MRKIRFVREIEVPDGFSTFDMHLYLRPGTHPPMTVDQMDMQYAAEEYMDALADGLREDLG